MALLLFICPFPAWEAVSLEWRQKSSRHWQVWDFGTVSAVDMKMNTSRPGW
jgi:hypothetical protein